MNEEMEVDLLEMGRIILKRKWIIIYVTLFSTMISALISFFVIKPVYESKVSIVIGKEEARIFYEDKYTNGDVTMYQKLVKTYAEIAQSNIVLQKTADNLDGYTMKDIKKFVTVVPKMNTEILEIKVKNNNRTDAMLIANELTRNFIVEANRVLPAGELNILDKAIISDVPVSPNIKLNIVIAFLLGVMISIGIVFLLEYMNTKVRTEEEIEKYLGIPVLVSIPNQNGMVVWKR